MTRRLVLGVFLALMTATAAAQMKRGAAADEAAIRELAKQYSSAWNSGDAAKAAAVYTDDAIFVNVRGTALVGRANIESGLAQDLAGELKGSTFEVTIDDIRFINPDTAVVHGTTAIKGAGSSPEGLKGHYQLVAAKQGSAWKALTVHAAAVPPPGPPK